MTGIYVASRVRHARMWRDLRIAGFPIISTWIDEAGPGETADMGSLWVRIGREISEASALVLYATSDDVPLKGALVEAGMALAAGLQVFVVLPGFEIELESWRTIGSWMAHLLVTKCRTLEDAMASAKALSDAPLVRNLSGPIRSTDHRIYSDPALGPETISKELQLIDQVLTGPAVTPEADPAAILKAAQKWQQARASWLAACEVDGLEGPEEDEAWDVLAVVSEELAAAVTSRRAEASR